MAMQRRGVQTVVQRLGAALQRLLVVKGLRGSGSSMLGAVVHMKVRAAPPLHCGLHAHMRLECSTGPSTGAAPSCK